MKVLISVVFTILKISLAQDELSIPLLRNLLEERNDNREVIFDEETGEAPEDEELDFMIADVCSGWTRKT